jgi:hypothetical protein
LGRKVAIGLPVVCVVTTLAIGLIAGPGSALLVLASGALLSAIALLWASVRTLSGDAPLPSGLETVAPRRSGTDELAERKNRVLRALKDLESEHALGKIDDADYEAIAESYRDEAKAVMREIDAEMAPLLEEAERMAREYLAEHTGGGAQNSTDTQTRDDRASSKNEGDVQDASREPSTKPAAAEGRVACPACRASNEVDASFCKQCGASMKTATSTEKIDAAT